MSRIKPLNEQVFDVVVVGGGIHGTTTAWALSGQGCSVALLEKDDFGAAASANSQKIIHGGLRYLQQLDIKRMRESIVARRKAFQLLPHLAHPAAFMVPTGGFFLRSKAALLAAMIANDVVSFDRNAGVPPSHRLGMGRVRSRAFLESVAPGLARQGTGAGIWYDGFAESTERFTLAFVIEAERNGAVVLNHVRAGRILTGGGRAIGCEATDILSGEQTEVRARHIVLATGGWLDEAGDQTGCRHGSWTRAYNIMVNKRFFGEYGVGLETTGDYPDEQAVLKRGKRNYFFAPWRSGTIIGTMYKTFPGNPDDCGLTPREIEDYLREINTLYPEAELDMGDVTFAHAGILPSRRRKDGAPGTDPAKDTVLVESETAPGVLHIIGVKYTTAVQVAGVVARRILARDGKTPGRTPGQTVYGGEEIVTGEAVRKKGRELSLELDAPACDRIARLYGTVAARVLALCEKNPDLALPLGPSGNVLAAEVLHAARAEHARRLADVVFRRTDLGTFAYPGREALRQAAGLMARELGWDATTAAAEISAVEAVYQKMGCAHVLQGTP